MSIFPSKPQWIKWTLPGKASYIGAWLGGIGLIIGLVTIIIPLLTATQGRPLISILSLDSLLHQDSLETKFVIKNVGDMPAFFLVKSEAYIDDARIDVSDKRFETQFQTIMPHQVLRYGALTIKGNGFKMLMSGPSVPKITQAINVSYGASEKTIGEYFTFQEVKLNSDKLRSKRLDGLWLLENSKSK